MGQNLRYALDTSRLVASAARFAGVANRNLRDAWTDHLRSLARRVVGITPPSNERTPRGRNGTITTDDKRRGEASLARDLAAIFVPVDRARIGPRGADPGPIHRRVFIKNKIPGKALKNDQGQPYFVDATQLRALERKLKRKVGRLAGQWNSGVESVGARSPAWVARHGHADGRHRLVFSPGMYHFEMAATDVPDKVRGELLRRIGYAERYARRAKERGLRAILAKTAGQSGFDTRF